MRKRFGRFGTGGKPFRVRIAFGIAVLLAAVCFAGYALWRPRFEMNQSIPCKQCNVILISVDTLRADDLQCYGYAKVTAPNLCRFASDATLFNRSYSHTSFTFDSHMSIMTSLYPSSHGMLDQFSQTLGPDIPTLAGTLKGNGYRTLYVGPDFADPTMPYGDRRYGFDQTFGTPMVDVSGWQRGLQAFSDSVSKGKKTFLFLHTYFVHDPYLTADVRDRMHFPGKPFAVPLTSDEYFRYDTYFRDAVLSLTSADILSSPGAAGARIETIQKAFASARTQADIETAAALLTEPERSAAMTTRYDMSYAYDDSSQVSFIRSLYDKRISQFDHEFARFLSWLSNSSANRNTVVIVTSDHGEEFMEHGQMNHGQNIFGSQTRVPLVVSVPGIPGKTSDIYTGGIDVFPTVLGLLGLSAPAGLQGRDLTPSILGRRIDEGHVISEHRGGVERVIRNGIWSLYVNRDGKSSLYDTTTDPGERTDIATRHPDVIASLRQVMDAALAGLPKHTPLRKPYPVWVDEAKRRKMMEQGYFW